MLRGSGGLLLIFLSLLRGRSGGSFGRSGVLRGSRGLLIRLVGLLGGARGDFFGGYGMLC
jgi:hypothetical protein